MLLLFVVDVVVVGGGVGVVVESSYFLKNIIVEPFVPATVSGTRYS